MSEREAFRRETREWLEANVPPALRGKVGDREAWPGGGRKAVYKYPESRQWMERAAERGWTAPSWPRQYGGGGHDKDEAQIIAQEIQRLQAPPPLAGFGTSMIGPTLLQYGTEEQRREHLPRITSGEIRWCQGYSEPNAGSDLASLQTAAVLDGDSYVVNGQKIWTSGADQADWIFMLVRTDPKARKQAGITFLLVDMTSPGIEVRPIRLISGASPFCETFFQNVVVPARNVVGEVDSGWTVAKALLGHERSSIGGLGSGAQRVPLARLAKQYVGEKDGRIADPVLRDQVVQNEMDSMSFGLTVKRHSDALAAGHQPGPESSLFKYYGTEINMRRNELMVRIAGPAALGWEGPGFDESELALTRDWLRSRGYTIEGGTSEIQLNIIAKRVLGLPEK